MCTVKRERPLMGDITFVLLPPQVVKDLLDLSHHRSSSSSEKGVGISQRNSNNDNSKRSAASGSGSDASASSFRCSSNS